MVAATPVTELFSLYLWRDRALVLIDGLLSDSAVDLSEESVAELKRVKRAIRLPFEPTDAGIARGKAAQDKLCSCLATLGHCLRGG